MGFTGVEAKQKPILAPPLLPQEIYICSAKLSVPKFTNLIERARLRKLLEKNAEQFGATLITGRAGTGKTALASAFAQNYEKVAWYSIGAADRDWQIFYSYIRACFSKLGLDLKTGESLDFSETEIARNIENLFARLSVTDKNKPALIVLDDVHYVYNCVWFESFFNSLLASLTPNTNLLMLTRSQPPLPLWRLRSKQILGVVDEKLLILNTEETEDLFHKKGFSKTEAENFYEKSFGRISEINFPK